MQIEQVKLLRDPVEYENHPLLVTMQAFFDYATHIAEYSALVLDFMQLNKEMIDAAEDVLEYANDMKKKCYWSLTQVPLNDLLRREASILDEIKQHSNSLTLCEFSLDKYLVFADGQPEIRSVFLTKNGLPLFDAANC